MTDHAVAVIMRDTHRHYSRGCRTDLDGAGVSRDHDWGREFTST